jgi:hypothetical protein
MKMKPGQIVRMRGNGHGVANIFYVLDTKFPKMLIYCIDNPHSYERDACLEVYQANFEVIRGNKHKD